MAGVVGDGYAAIHRRLAVRYDQIGEALRRLTDREAVHAVQADAQHAAQARRAERQRREEAAFDLFLIPGDRLKLCALLRRESGAFQPALIFRHIIHWDHLICYLSKPRAAASTI